MNPGFIKLNRKLNKWGWKTDPNMVALWVHLLTNASYEDNEYLGIKLAPGQLVTGRKKLSLDTGISQQTIRTCLERLKSTNELTIASTSKYSIISITKWYEYQMTNQVNGQQPTSNQPTTNQQLTTTKEGKEGKEGRAPSAARLSPDWNLDSTMLDYALQEGLSKSQAETEAKKFKNYWLAKSGKAATKLDWPATWRNWVLSAVNYLDIKPKRKPNGRTRPEPDAYEALMAKGNQN